MKSTSGDSRWRRRFITIAIVAVLVLMLQLLRVWLMPALQPWHTVRLDTEFVAGADARDLSAYLEMEQALFDELDQKILIGSDDPDGAQWNRYLIGGPNNPETFSHNWNRTFELKPEQVRGGALLLHGLTDSPYSLRQVGQILYEQGFYVLGLRLPGHGTTPAALTRIRVEDWVAATRIGAHHVRKTIGDQRPFLVIGYSNGGALAVNHAIEALDDPDLGRQDGLVLFSPAIGITRFARLASWHRLFTILPGLDALRFSSLEPEIDPYKYGSFAKNGGYQTHRLTRIVQSRLEKLDRAGSISELPPILSFVSLADATVRVEAVVEALYSRLPNDKHELVIFDVNRQAAVIGLLSNDPGPRLRAVVDQANRHYQLTIISNGQSDSTEVSERRFSAESGSMVERALELHWPRGLYSLSHVALPFPPDDPVYGNNPTSSPGHGLALGALEPRGERGLLRIPVHHLMRLRWNPFFSYVEERLNEFVTDEIGQNGIE